MSALPNRLKQGSRWLETYCKVTRHRCCWKRWPQSHWETQSVSDVVRCYSTVCPAQLLRAILGIVKLWTAVTLPSSGLKLAIPAMMPAPIVL